MRANRLTRILPASNGDVSGGDKIWVYGRAASGLTTPGGAVISPTFPGGCADAANRPRHPGRGPRPVVPVHRDRDRPWCATLGLRLALAPLLDRFYYDRCRRRL